MNYKFFIVGYNLVCILLQMLVLLFNKKGMRFKKPSEIKEVIKKGEITDEEGRKQKNTSFFLFCCSGLRELINFGCSTGLLIWGIFKFGVFSSAFLKLFCAIVGIGWLMRVIAGGIFFLIRPNQMKELMEKEE